MFNEKIAKLINGISKTKNVYLSTHSPQLLSLLDIDFNNLFILNDPNYGEPKTINFDSAIHSLPEKMHKDNFCF